MPLPARRRPTSSPSAIGSKPASSLPSRFDHDVVRDRGGVVEVDRDLAGLGGQVGLCRRREPLGSAASCSVVSAPPPSAASPRSLRPRPPVLLRSAPSSAAPPTSAGSPLSPSSASISSLACSSSCALCSCSSCGVEDREGGRRRRRRPRTRRRPGEAPGRGSSSTFSPTKLTTTAETASAIAADVKESFVVHAGGGSYPIGAAPSSP